MTIRTRPLLEADAGFQTNPFEESVISMPFLVSAPGIIKGLKKD